MACSPDRAMDGTSSLTGSRGFRNGFPFGHRWRNRTVMLPDDSAGRAAAPIAVSPKPREPPPTAVGTGLRPDIVSVLIAAVAPFGRWRIVVPLAPIPLPAAAPARRRVFDASPKGISFPRRIVFAGRTVSRSQVAGAFLNIADFSKWHWVVGVVPGMASCEKCQTERQESGGDNASHGTDHPHTRRFVDRVRPVLPAHLRGTRPWTNIGRSLVLIEKIRKTFPSSHSWLVGFDGASPFRA